MSHQDLALSLYNTAVCIKSSGPKTLNHEEICRGVYSRLYYSLFHTYLHHDDSLNLSKEKSQHNEMMLRIKKSSEPDIIILYSKMLNLRIWADYKLAEHIPPGPKAALLTIEPLLLQVYALIKKSAL